MQLTTDLSLLTPEVRNALVRKLQHADKARYDIGLVEQAQMKQFHDRAGIGSYKQEIGPAQMIMSRDQWQRAMQRYGEKIFMDEQFVPWLLKKNPDMRVKQVGTKIQSGYTGKGDSRA
jgi:hypothetical protein